MEIVPFPMQPTLISTFLQLSFPDAFQEIPLLLDCIVSLGLNTPFFRIISRFYFTAVEKTRGGVVVSICDIENINT